MSRARRTMLLLARHVVSSGGPLAPALRDAAAAVPAQRALLKVGASKAELGDLSTALRFLGEDAAMIVVAKAWPPALSRVAHAMEALPSTRALVWRALGPSLPYVLLAGLVTLSSRAVLGHWVSPVFAKMLDSQHAVRSPLAVAAEALGDAVPWLLVPLCVWCWSLLGGNWPRPGLLASLRQARLCTLLAELMDAGMAPADAHRVARKSIWGVSHLLQGMDALPPGLHALRDAARHQVAHAQRVADRVSFLVYAGGVGVLALYAAFHCCAVYLDVASVAVLAGEP